MSFGKVFSGGQFDACWRSRQLFIEAMQRCNRRCIGFRENVTWEIDQAKVLGVDPASSISSLRNGLTIHALRLPKHSERQLAPPGCFATEGAALPIARSSQQPLLKR